MARPFDVDAEVSDIGDPEVRELVRRMLAFHNDLWYGPRWRRSPR